LSAVFLHHAHRALADFRGKLRGLVHGSILSRVGASSNPGAVHLDQVMQTLPGRVPDRSEVGIRPKPLGEVGAVLLAQGLHLGIAALLVNLAILVALAAIKTSGEMLGTHEISPGSGYLKFSWFRMCVA
ncbi:MAG: hypothetical protein WC859_09820, partial [Elusimicrobiota bacterium]